MEYVLIAIVIAVVLGMCFLLDFLFKKLFRSQAQHMSGLAVRLHKRYATIGIIMIVLGIAALIAAFTQEQTHWLLFGGGVLIAVVGTALVVYYVATGIFYDGDSFIYTTIGKKKKVYYYRDIRSQQLYNNAGQLLIELYMADGTAVQVQGSMVGAVEFLDHAYAAWVQQTGRREEDCSFHDPANSIWFPPVEV